MTGDAIRRQLETKLTEYQGRAARLRADLSDPLSADFSDQANQTQDDEAQEAEDAVLAQEISMVKAALSRLDNGEYGYCTRCGEEISPGRLETIPEAALCITCAGKRDAA